MSTPDTFEVKCTFTTEGPKLDQPVRVVSLSGEEHLSKLYHFNVEVAADSGEIGLETYIGARAMLTLTNTAHERIWDGVVSGVTLHPGDTAAVHAIFTVAPELVFLTVRQDSRIFQKLSTKQIVEKVLADALLYQGRVDWKISGKTGNSPREYCVQYRETDFAFISRLLEEDGIFFYFKPPPPDSKTQTERLIFCDSVDQSNDIVDGREVSFFEEAGPNSQERISRIDLRSRAAPNARTLRDYNFEKAHLKGMERTSMDLEDNPAGKRDSRIFEYPGGYAEPEQGGVLASARLEAARIKYLTAQGKTTTLRFAPGHRFRLVDHPRADLDQTYFIWSTKYRASFAEELSGTETRPQIYVVSFVATPMDVVVRPARETEKPRIYGTQTALVVGPKEEEIHVDEYGRIRVQFHWDRQGKEDEHSSCWVRTAQSFAGGGWGAMVIPRIGMEVVVAFLEGDPDRPLVTGAVYNNLHPVPYPLPQHKTKSVFKTNSSPGGDGFNELTFEDAKNQELIDLHAQKDFHEKVLHDHIMGVDNNEAITVKHSHSISAGSISHSSGSSHSESAGTDHTRTAKKKITDHAGTDYNCTADANINEKAIEIHMGASSLIEGVAPTIDLLGTDVKVRGMATMTDIGEALTNIGTTTADYVSPSVTVVGTDSLGLNGGFVLMKGNPIFVTSEGTVTVQGAPVEIRGGNITITGGSITVKGSGVSITGDTIKLNC